MLAAASHILKAYGSERAVRGGAAPACAAARGGPLRAPAFVAALPELRLTVQRRVAGARPPAAADAPRAAGALAAALQGARAARPPAAPPERLLGAARARRT